jgi:Ring finger domain
MGATVYISGNRPGMGCIFEYDNPITDLNYQTNISFSLENWSTVQTLSANTNPDGSSEIKGLLYVPTLSRSDPCISITAPYIPHNVTRKTDFPSYQDAVPLVTVAPWVSVDCTQSFLAAGRRDGVRAAIFYQPGNSSTEPPAPGDSSWSLDDGGQWKETNQYPVYAIPSVMGGIVMQELGLYSGNMTDVPYGDDLVTMYDPRDFARLYTDISLGSGGPALPSLWVFLIIVLGILLAVAGITSLIMHLIQRKHRRDLQRRITRGEVNLEALGIKRLNVPQELLDKMPRYVYTSKDGAAQQLATKEASTSQPGNLDAAETAARAALPKREVPFTQPTCSICLDDFEHNQTIVRELPCSHIFHPECIDGFLRDNSSLCPMCKKSALPQGYLVTDVTNAMVRRERLIRRMRERVTTVTLEDGTTVTQPRTYQTSGGRRMASFHRQFGRTNRRRRAESAHAAASLARAGGNTEMATVPTDTAPELSTSIEPPPEIQRAGTLARREWGRNRLRSAVLQTRTADDEARAMVQAMPRCKFIYPLYSQNWTTLTSVCRAKIYRERVSQLSIAYIWELLFWFLFRPCCVA